MTRLARHLIVALLAGTALNAQVASAPQPGSAIFDISIRGQRVGQESVTLSKTETGGWLISATGAQMTQTPFTLDKFELRYTADWQPQSMYFDALAGTVTTITTNFTERTAASDVTQGGQKSAGTQNISPKTIVLPNNVFAAYEAVAARLHTSAPGATFPFYVVPQAEVTATVTGMTTQRVQIPDAIIDLRHFSLSVKIGRAHV